MKKQDYINQIKAAGNPWGKAKEILEMASHDMTLSWSDYIEIDKAFMMYCNN